MAHDTNEEIPYRGNKDCPDCYMPMDPVKAMFSQSGSCTICQGQKAAKLVQNRMVKK